MKVYPGPYLILYIPGKKFEIKEIIIPIRITATFVSSCFGAIKIAVSFESSQL